MPEENLRLPTTKNPEPLIASLENESKEANSPYCKYAIVKIQDIAGAALIDSGNTWKSAISEEFADRLGIEKKDLKAIPVQGLKTAAGEEGLQVLGETKHHLYISLDTMTSKLKFKPAVIRGLSMHVNISGPFLKKHHISHFPAHDCLYIKNRKIPLYASLPSPNEFEKIEGDIIFPKEVKCPPYSVNHVNLIIPHIKEGKMPALPGTVIGCLDFMAKTDCHPWLNAIATPEDRGDIRVGILNTSHKEIRIPARTNYGSFKLICTEEEQLRYPWRIAAISTPKLKAEHEECQHSKETEKSEEEAFMRGPTNSQNCHRRKKFINTIFNLEKADELRTEELRNQATNLLLKYWTVFSFDGSFGATDLIKHTIYTKEGPPINQRYRPINPNLEPHLKTQLDEWARHDVIEKSNSPYNFGLVCVPKKNGKFRWCIDYRELNKISKRDTFPIGNIEDNLARLSTSKIFSGLDGSGAFHVIPLAEESKEKTAFATPFGLYQFKRLPFGLANGPATYARLIKMVLGEIPTDIAIPYLDDTIIHSPTIERHFQDLDRVLQAHEKAGLKLQPAKCQLFKSSIDYLGHRVSEHGIAPLQEHTEIIKKWEIPQTRNEVRSFLGKIGYYRRFIKNFAGLARPLTDRLKKDGTHDREEFQIDKDFETAFGNLKKELLRAPILAYPQFKSEHPFILDTDWSYDNSAIGAVLSQVQDGKERVIAYGGKKLAQCQRNYGPTKGELYAVIYFVNHYKYYLAHRKFVIRTDHQALKYISGMDPPSGVILRWLTLLSNFEFAIQYRPGTRHQNADALSRVSHLTETDEVPMVDEYVASIQPSPTWTAAYLKQQQTADREIEKLRLKMTTKAEYTRDEFLALSPLGRRYAQLRPDMIIDRHGLVRFQLPETHSPFSQIRYVYLTPENLVKDAVMRAHKQIAHLGPKATFNRLKLHAYFPNMLRRIQQILLLCGPCQTKTTRKPDQHHTLKSRPTGFPFQTLSLDFVGPFPPSTPRRNVYLLTIKDVFTRWIEAFPLKAATAQEVARILNDEIFSRFGKCEQIHSDRGTQFTGSLLKELGQLLNIKITQTPAYNPKSNPVERSHREIKAALTALSSTQPSKWDTYIPEILYAIRISVSRSTGFSPYQLMFGRDPIDDLDTLFPTPKEEIESFNRPEYFQKLRTRTLQAFQIARDNMGISVSRQRRAYYHPKRQFEEGNTVWLFTPLLGQRQVTKLHTGWSGPWIVCRRINDVTYEIEPSSKLRHARKEVVSIDRLRRYADDEGTELIIDPVPGLPLTFDGDFFVEGPPLQTIAKHSEQGIPTNMGGDNSNSSEYPTTNPGKDLNNDNFLSDDDEEVVGNQDDSHTVSNHYGEDKRKENVQNPAQLSLNNDSRSSEEEREERVVPPPNSPRIMRSLSDEDIANNESPRANSPPELRKGAQLSPFTVGTINKNKQSVKVTQPQELFELRDLIDRHDARTKGSKKTWEKKTRIQTQEDRRMRYKNRTGHSRDSSEDRPLLRSRRK